MKTNDSMDFKHNDINESFQSHHVNKELLAKVIEGFPYPIQVYTLDGTSVAVNRTLLAEYNVSSPDMIVGKYNLFNDLDIITSGQIDKLNRAFHGEVVIFSDVKVPLEGIAKRYSIHDLDVEAVYQDITLFPVFDKDQNVAYVAAFLVNRRIYRGKEVIEKAKEYLESHWKEEYNLDKTAKVAGLSKAHFIKLFKKNTGLTPHKYYMNYKIEKIKEKLLDTNLSIAEAFAACNMNYNGHTARIFKEKTGLSPSAYRKILSLTETEK
ncbi:MAG: helix-turn-helix transcriptional regulator [Clostridiales bacterium]|nr:helix-turn-helix transcriptional regulator [Clostridiales bacterium]